MTQKLGFCFDFDGTIVNSIDIVWKIQDEILKKYNIKRTEELDRKIYAKINEILHGENRKNIGKPILIAIFKLLGLNLFQRINALILAGKVWKKESQNITLIEGTEELFEFLEEKGYPFSIITTSSTLEVEDRLLEKYPHFYNKIKDKLIARDVVKNLKPHPESLIKAAELMKIPVKNCVVVGDMESDIELGKAIGAITIGVLTGFLGKEQFEKLGADFILNSIAEIPNIINDIERRVNS
ncbi:MAG: HAD family hydrolase [Promethearchaeota archaeon]